MRRVPLLALLTCMFGCSMPSVSPTCFDWTTSSPASAQLRALGYQGGGPSFAAVLRAYLAHESPAALDALSLDDEGDALRICGDERSLAAARAATERLEHDPALLRAMSAVAIASDEME